MGKADANLAISIEETKILGENMMLKNATAPVGECNIIQTLRCHSI